MLWPSRRLLVCPDTIQATPPPTPRNHMTSPTIRLAVVGAGHWGPNLIRNFDNAPISLVRRVVDLDTERLAQVRARFPHVELDETIAGALADPEIDAFVVATPTSTHHAIVKAALLAGKHVLVEKPI